MKQFIDKLISRLEEEKAKSIYDSNSVICIKDCWKKSIEIVTQLAEEYKHYALCYLQSPCEFQNENTILPASEFADDNGWIPVSERLPENNKVVLCWVVSTTIASGETFIIGSCDRGFWFLQTYEIGHHHFPVEDYEVVAWCELPAPYQTKGE